MIRTLLCVLAACCMQQASAQQQGDAVAYPTTYFDNPLDIPISLAGNFGECRPGHFHSGLDIKTQGKENLPVHAAADGYISRIKMDKGGFGHALYITHPNGYTTLYAHLNDFAPAIQKYLKKEQYEKKHWDVDIQLTPDQFPVKRGDQIAWSGNTGASTAPHLHFEIRDTKTEHPLNPQLFGLPVADKTPPAPVELVLYGPDKLNGGFNTLKRFTIKLAKKDSLYVPSAPERYDDKDFWVNGDTINVESPDVGIGINVDDHMEGSDNTIAFYTAQLFFDYNPQMQVTLNNIGYDETRYINAYTDYKMKRESNKWVQCLFKLPGNHLDRIYSNINSNSGRILWNDIFVHDLSIVITDNNGNISTVSAHIRSANHPWARAADNNNDPDINTFLPGQANAYSGGGVSYQLGENALYDKTTFAVHADKSDKWYSDKHTIGSPDVPVHSYFELQIKATKPVSAAMTGKVVMMYTDSKGQDGRAAVSIDNGWYKAKVRNFGYYWLDVDNIPPTITTKVKNNSNLGKQKEIVFEVEDDMTSVKTFSGYLDGKWICFEQHGSSFFYKFDEHCSKGKHKLVFKAEDENGNASSHELNFTR